MTRETELTRRAQSAPEWERPANIDEHPLRYSPLARTIEQILFRRALEHSLEGGTLETSIEIAEAVGDAQSAPMRRAGREEIARLIEPDAWAYYDEEPTYQPGKVRSSLTRADNILAALFPTQSQGDER